MRLKFCLSFLVLCVWPCLGAADDVPPCVAKPAPAKSILNITGKIIRIATGWGAEGIYITVDAHLPNCPDGDKTVFFMPYWASQVKETLSIALLAFSQARIIEAHYPNCIPDPPCGTTTSGASIRLVAIAVRAEP